VDGGGCWTSTLDQIAMKRLFGRWFKWLIWSVRDSESEEREARAHVKYLVKKGSPQSNVLKGHKAASWHDCRRKEGSFSGVSSGFTQIPCADEDENSERIFLNKLSSCRRPRTNCGDISHKHRGEHNLPAHCHGF